MTQGPQGMASMKHGCMAIVGCSMHQLPRYLGLIGRTDSSFLQRVLDAREVGWEQHGSLRWDREMVVDFAC